jgi:hypothetical protein
MTQVQQNPGSDSRKTGVRGNEILFPVTAHSTAIFRFSGLDLFLLGRRRRNVRNRLRPLILHMLLVRKLDVRRIGNMHGQQV